MRNPARTRQDQGVALVITLCALVLLTVLVVAFFSKAQLNRQISFTSSNIGKSDQLARAATGMILGELRQEIAESSDILQGDPENPNPNFLPVYKLKTGMSPSPVKRGVDEEANLVGVASETITKVSANGIGIRPSSTVLGSDVSISTPSVNGRKITSARWFQDSGGPQLGSQSTLPTWIYFTRSGPKNPTPVEASDRKSADYVVGRYAYTVYDVSGRLNANVAGFPSTAQANAGTKSSVAYADLSELDSTLFTTGPTGTVDAFVNWRNAEAALNAAAYDTYLKGAAASDGFIHVTNDKPAQFTQQRFVSRRDLLNSAASTHVGKLPGLTEYFTHFSRSSSRPTWTPSADATGPQFAYLSNAEKKEITGGYTVANRNLANLRHQTAATSVLHYYDNGTTHSYEVEPGDPVVPRRFSLAKLAWIGHDGPPAVGSTKDPFDSSADRTQAIKDCFGLTWNNSDKRWEYDHGGSRRILTLGEIQGREPDFFEMLKAGILSGSLGQDPGPAFHTANQQPGAPSQGVWGTDGKDFDVFSSNTDKHILQIGVNIIDQADANNFPTAIYADFEEKPRSDILAQRYPAIELYNTVFGDENLPGLTRMTVVTAITQGTSGGKADGLFEDVWIQPEVWNPHDSATADPNGLSASAKYPTPTALRLVTFGGCSVSMTETENLSNVIPKTRTAIPLTIDFGSDPRNPSPAGMIYFKNPSPTSSLTALAPFFNKPVLLKGYGTSANGNYSNPNSMQPFGTTKNTHYYELGQKSAQETMGVWLCQFPRDAKSYDGSHSITVDPTGSPGIDPQLTFVLQYHDGTNWRPYSMMGRIVEAGGQSGSSNSWSELGWFQWDMGRPDPRTDRFSASAGSTQRAATTSWDWNGGAPFRTGAATNKDERGSYAKRIPFGPAFHFKTPLAANKYLVDDWSQNVDSASTYCFYRDADAVVRPGDAYRADFSTGDGVMLYDLAKASFVTSAKRRRPVILNRPFEAVGELGYVYRDVPFKTLDLWSEKSADAGLLDLFSVKNESEATVVAGLVNPNVASPKVFKALLKESAKQVTDPTQKWTAAELEAVSTAITDEIENSGTLSSQADLATRFSSDPIFDAFSAAAGSTQKPISNKTYGETPVRALSNVVSFREWNLLVDVVAQVGRVTPGGTLGDFVVEGEKRYWLHATIDRYTGKVIDSQLEPVE